MPKAKKFTISVPTYKVLVDFYVSGNINTLRRWDDKIERYFGRSGDKFNSVGRAYPIYIEEGYRKASVVINEKSLTVGTLAHEIFHITFFIANYVDLHICFESEEAFAYLHEYLMQSAYNELKDRIKDDF